MCALNLPSLQSECLLSNPPSDSKKAEYSVLMFGPQAEHHSERLGWSHPEGARTQTSCTFSGLQLVVAELFSNKHNQTSPPPQKIREPFQVAGIHRPGCIQLHLASVSQASSQTQTPRPGSLRPLSLTATRTTLQLIHPAPSVGGEPTVGWTHVAPLGGRD